MQANYIVGQDFMIKKIAQRSQKNKQRIFYYLSFDCFEKICMMSRTEQGNSVRDYFITLRKFIDYYREHFANKINSLTTTGKYLL